VGALLAGIGNLLHPVTPRDDEGGVAQVIARSDAWTLIHLLIIAGVVAMLVGLIGLRSILPDEGKSGGLAHLGLQFALVGTVLGIATVILDGVAAKQLADQWALALPADRGVALRIVSASETLNFALAGIFNAMFAGVPFVLFGLALVEARLFRTWFGWLAVAAGSGSIGAGLVQALSGRPTVASLVLTIIGPTIIALWMLALGGLLWRAARNDVAQATSGRDLPGVSRGDHQERALSAASRRVRSDDCRR
jgi:hypothetical protein